MKRLFCALLALCALVGAAAHAAVPVDLSGMTLEELYEMRALLDGRIAALEADSGVRVYESGSYVVGRDIPAGDYVLIENADAVFASVLVRADDSEESDLVTHHLINNRAVVRLAAETWVTLSEATAWPIESAPDEVPGTGEGGYLVGSHLPPGSYTITPLDKAPLSSYSVYDGILGSGEQLTKFEVLHKDVDIDLTAGEYIELSGCRLRTPGEDGE